MSDLEDVEDLEQLAAFITPDSSVRMAKEFLHRAWAVNQIVSCPCCTQAVKRYKCSLSYKHAKLLIAATQITHPGELFHMPSLEARLFPTFRGGGALLRYFELIESEKRSASGLTVPKATGWHRVTSLGREFANGEARIPKYIYKFDSAKYGEEGPLVSIADVVHDKFDYKAMMDEAEEENEYDKIEFDLGEDDDTYMVSIHTLDPNSAF